MIPGGRFALAVALCAASVVVPGALAASKVESKFEPTFYFQDWKTFDFKATIRAPGEALAGREDAEELIHKAVLDQLVRAGMVHKTEGEPDFLVAWYAGIGTKFGGRNLNYGLPNQFSRDFRDPVTTEGTLTLDLIDAATNQLVWRGNATEVVVPGEGKKLLPGAVAELVRRFVADRDARRSKSAKD